MWHPREAPDPRCRHAVVTAHSAFTAPEFIGSIGVSRANGVSAAVLFTACALAVTAAIRTGIPVYSVESTGTVIALIAALVCIRIWQFADQLRPLQLAWRALTVGAVAGGVILLAQAAGLRTARSPRTSSFAEVSATILVLALLLIAGGVALIAAWRTVQRLLRPGRVAHRPAVGEVWNAQVPFADDEIQSKDRPVLVIATGADQAEVLKITSQDKSDRGDHLHLPQHTWGAVLTKESWLGLTPISLPYADFRSLRGTCPPSAWQQIKEGALGRGTEIGD